MANKASKAGGKKRRNRAMLPAVSEAMAQWAAAIGTELETWPKVSKRPMMGMTAYYVGKKIFAVVPKTRSFFADKGIGVRIETFSEKQLSELMKDKRALTNPIGKKWVSFEVDAPGDLREVLRWLSEAYEGERKGN